LASNTQLTPAIRITLIVIGVLLLAYAIYLHNLVAGLYLLLLIIAGVALILLGSGKLRLPK
jgi:hypothetical protein